MMLTDQATRPWGRSGTQLSSAPVGLLASLEVVGGTRAPDGCVHCGPFWTGTGIDESMGEALKVTVIATGFDELAEESAPEVSQEIRRPPERTARDTMVSSLGRPVSTLRQPTQRGAQVAAAVRRTPDSFWRSMSTESASWTASVARWTITAREDWQRVFVESLRKEHGRKAESLHGGAGSYCLRHE